MNYIYTILATFVITIAGTAHYLTPEIKELNKEIFDQKEKIKIQYKIISDQKKGQLCYE